MNSKTKKITTIGMLCALAYALVATIRIPLILFLEYEPKDVIIAIGGLIWGPFISFLVSSIVSTIEMITISEDGIYGLIMNQAVPLPALPLLSIKNDAKGLG